MFAGEYAVLQNGFRIYADRHEIVADRRAFISAREVWNCAAGEISSSSKLRNTFLLLRHLLRRLTCSKQRLRASTDSPGNRCGLPRVNNGLRPEFVRSVAAVESAYRLAAISPKGAIGLMQFMPGNGRRIGSRSA